MAFQFKPVNWRLLAQHLLAIPFLVVGARQLQLVKSAAWLELYVHDKAQAMQKVPPSFGNAEFIAWLSVGPLVVWFLAIVLGCALSALVVWRRRESWLIPIGLFFLAIVTSWTRYYESKAVLGSLAFLRLLFEAWPLEVQLGIVGGALIAVGLLLLLLPLRWRIGAGTTATPLVAA